MAKHSRKATKAPPRRSREASGTKDRGRGILTRVNPEGLRALRILAIEQDRTLQSLAVEALNDVLAKYGQRAVVKNPLSED